MMKKILYLLLLTASFLFAGDSLYCHLKIGGFHELSSNIKAGGDLNGDGYDDLVINDYYKIYVHFGRDVIDSIPDLELAHPLGGSSFYYGVNVVYNCDLNGDGYDDLVTSDPHMSTPNGTADGRVFIYWGGSDFDGEPDCYIDGGSLNLDSFELNFGEELAAGDFNADGFDDLAVYSPGASFFFFGHVHVFYGSAQFDTIPDWWKDGQPASYTGRNLTVGDLNRDGYDDLAFVRGLEEGTFIDLYPGLSGGLSAQPVWSQEINLGIHHLMGYRLLGHADYNGDGYHDLSFTGYNYNQTDTVRAKTMIFWGADNFLLGSQTISHYNYPINVSAGKLNNGNFHDLIVSYASAVPYDCKGTIYSYQGDSDFTSTGKLISSGLDSLYLFGKISYFVGDVNKDGYDEIVLGTNKIPYNAENRNWLGIYSIKQPVGISPSEMVKSNQIKINNYPNPFNNSTQICYDLHSMNFVQLDLYNSAGALVKQLVTRHQNEGFHSINLDAAGLNSSVYYLSLKAGALRQTKKIILIK